MAINITGLGNANGIGFKSKVSGGGSGYLPPELKDSIVGLWKFDQNTNESSARNIIKNTIKGKGGDLELLNFAYKANSGYNGYPEDFTSWRNSSHLQVEYSTDGSKFKITSENIKDWWLIVPNSGISNSFKVKITNCHFPIFWKYTDDGNTYKYITISEDGIYNLPQSIINNEGVVNRCCFGSDTQRNDYTGLTIEQLPLYEGALVTDGKDDMIVSQKTVQEMGITNEITVVSMIHQIGFISSQTYARNNYFIQGNNFLTNTVSAIGKTGIYGYKGNLSNITVVNDILGDKKDYVVDKNNPANINSVFSVNGTHSFAQLSQIAVYWTFISNKVLTTDEINQIIAYFKLDKYVTPQVIYDVKRQGLTNDTPNEDWYLKDFSGNGHDMQLYNYVKKGNSGVGKYIEDFTVWTKIGNFVTITDTSLIVTNGINKNWLLAKTSSNSKIESFRVKITGIPSGGTLSYLYTKSKEDTEATYLKIKEDGVYVLPSTVITDANISIGFSVGYFEDYTGLTIEQIPDYEGALVSDGKEDYGKAEGLPIFKDYTVAVDRAIIGTNKQVDGGVSAKCLEYNNGSYVIDYLDGSFSYGGYLPVMPTIDRIISYQSKYISNGKAISPVNTIDANEIYIAKLGIEERYSTIAVWSYLLFPYTLSEFLLERQLKKYKLGTLYPDMVEWRPIVKSNVEYDRVALHYRDKDIENGTYLAIGSDITIYVRLTSKPADEIKNITLNGIPATRVGVSIENVYQYKAKLDDKSPQKINITIDEYIRFEDIVQPYPCIVNIPKVDGGYYTYGDKIPVGYRFRRESAINLLPELYSLSDIFLNGELCNVGAEIIVSKYMVFTANKTWLLDTTEPHAIYSPQKLNIPNSSLKILGHVPDLTGKGNHGKLNNFAYTEDSGVAADGSVKLDGIDDHITIPTLAHGGKCVMMKVNWQSSIGQGILYDQRGTAFAIWNSDKFEGNETDTIPAYSARNEGNTYIDGILNKNILASQLRNITHNIVATNTMLNGSSVSPIIGCRTERDAYFANMSLYEFMLFPEIPSEDEIKKLNDVMGIEGGYVESPNYYWDAYGKKNTDADRNLIAD